MSKARDLSNMVQEVVSPAIQTEIADLSPELLAGLLKSDDPKEIEGVRKELAAWVKDSAEPVSDWPEAWRGFAKAKGWKLSGRDEIMKR